LCVQYFTSIITIIAVPPTPQAEFVMLQSSVCGGRGEAEFGIIIECVAHDYSFLDGVAFCKLLLTARDTNGVGIIKFSFKK